MSHSLKTSGDVTTWYFVCHRCSSSAFFCRATVDCPRCGAPLESTEQLKPPWLTSSNDDELVLSQCIDQLEQALASVIAAQRQLRTAAQLIFPIGGRSREWQLAGEEFTRVRRLRLQLEQQVRLMEISVTVLPSCVEPKPDS